MKNLSATYKWVFLFLTLIPGHFTIVSGQNKFRLFAPTDGMTITNNMPNLSWKSIPCDYYELWIDGIRMDKISSNQHSYVAFPLSFGKHLWKVIAVSSSGRIESNTMELTVDDGPLAELPPNAILIRNDWKVKSSLETGINGATISSSKIMTKGWATTSVPATVLTALVRNGIYPNPYIGTNNMLIPDCSDEFNKDYDLLKYSHIVNKNPWKAPYWFRNTFTVPANYSEKIVWLNFSEINYKAEVWLNGIRIADTTQAIGMERPFRFDVTSVLKMTGQNILAVAIYPPNHPGKPAAEPLTPLADPGTNMADGVISHDYTKWDVMGWDWQPSIRDRDMGITEDVFLSTTDKVELDHLYATSNLLLPDTTSADITVSANLVNHSNIEQEGIINLLIKNGSDVITFNQDYKIPANSTVEFLWDKTNVKQLQITNAKLWWPSGYGQQNLYELTLLTKTKTNQRAIAKTTFGIRKVETYIGAKERVFKINGREIYPKGGNWVIDMMLNWNASRYEKEILLTKNANLNILRIWGPTGVAPKALYDAADKYGILIWQDFLNDFWGTFRNKPGYQPDISLFEKATTDIVLKLRNHPSLMIWCGGNEGINPREELIGNILKKYDGRESHYYLKSSNGDGLHGGGPYHTLEPKAYFTTAKISGFSSEIGPSGVPVFESVIKFIPEMGKTWMKGRFPIDGTWAYHDANDWPGNDTRKFSSYDNIVQKYYGVSDSTGIHAAEAYLNKCQLVNYDVYRSSIEAINRQLWTSSSGILLWKSNSSWPSITWQLYDWYLQAHAGYYGAKKAGEPIHVQLNRDDQSVSLVNLLNQKLTDVTIKATLLDVGLKSVWNMSKLITIGSNSSIKTGIEVPESNQTEFLKLVVEDKSGQVLSENFYWLNKSDNFKEMDKLPAPKLSVDAKLISKDINHQIQVTVSNKGTTLAFMLALKIVGKESGQEILPCIWSDNYLNLLPGESKTLMVEIANDDLTESPVIQYAPFGSSNKPTVEIK
jgi:hypothetical protein